VKSGSISGADLVGLPRDDAGPVFREPWEAQAFALAVGLSEAGYFTWSEWAVVLGQQIKAAQTRDDPDLGDTYYEHWVRTLEAICATRHLILPDALRRRTEDWRSAYINTPHGQPVELPIHSNERTPVSRLKSPNSGEPVRTVTDDLPSDC
jgi:nitrile hydratase accessory protein